MSKELKFYCIIGKLVCKLANVLGIIGVFAMWIFIFVYAFVG